MVASSDPWIVRKVVNSDPWIVRTVVAPTLDGSNGDELRPLVGSKGGELRPLVLREMAESASIYT